MILLLHQRNLFFRRFISRAELAYGIHILPITCRDVIPPTVSEFQTRRHMAGNLVSHNNGVEGRSEKSRLLVLPRLRSGAEFSFTMRRFN